MSGITVTTGVRVGPSGTDASIGSTLFLVGTAERGPINKARLVLSVAQFDTIYGAYSSATTLRDPVRTFFEEGGSRCYIARTVNGVTTKATCNIVDGAGVPATVLTLSAANEGVWANSSLSAPVKDGLKATVTVTGSTYALSITYQGTTIFSGGPWQDEVQPDGSTKFAKQFAADAVNADSYAANFVTATVGASIVLPVAVAGQVFTGGVDNLASVIDTDIVAAMALFDYDLGAGAVAAPGRNGDTIWAALRDHAAANRRIALCAFAVGTTSAAAITSATTYYGTTDASRTKGSYMAFYWPSVKVPDGFGGLRDSSPEAWVAAARCRQFRAAGPWRPAAGAGSEARYVGGIYQDVSRSLATTLDAARINAIRIINGNPRIYGARSASADETNWRFITYRDTLNYITAQAETSLEPLVFAPIDGRGNLFGQISAILTGILDPIRAAGGVFEGFDPITGQQLDRGYSVEASRTNNPVATLASGKVTASVGARVSPIADQINVTITKSTLSAAV